MDAHPKYIQEYMCLHCRQVCSEYHYLVLYADRLVAVNQVSGKVVSEVNWGPGVHASGIIGEDSVMSAQALSLGYKVVQELYFGGGMFPVWQSERPVSIAIGELTADLGVHVRGIMGKSGFRDCVQQVFYCVDYFSTF